MRALAVASVAAVAAAGAAPASAVTTSPATRGCDRLDDAACMLPFPNDAFTNPSASHSSRRLAFNARLMPRGARGERLSAAPYRTFDGFSPASTIMARVPGLDTAAALRRTRAVTYSDISRYSARNAPVLVFDSRTGKRVPIWVELDMQARRPRDRLLLIHPARNLRESQRYVVVLRDLRTARGRLIQARARFAALRDDRRRTARYQLIFRALRRAGIKRDRSLFLVWDFTIASERSLTGRMQSIRDNAFGQLGDADLADGAIAGAAPAHTVAELPLTGGDAQYAGRFARVVQGTVAAPCYLDAPDCAPAGGFYYDRAGDFVPAQRSGAIVRPRFTCVIPATANASNPARLLLYAPESGSDREVLTRPDVARLAAEHNLVLCAAAERRATGNVSDIADARQQGMLEALILGRLMSHPAGLPASAHFQDGGRPLVTSGGVRLYDAARGGALAAFGPDFTRAALVAPALRSAVLDGAVYRDALERPLVRELQRILLDRAEAAGVAGHLGADPPPNTPAHAILLQAPFAVAGSGHEAADALARSIGARVHQPAFAPGRAGQRRPAWGLAALPAEPWFASGIVHWDAGQSEDPADAIRRTPTARRQVAQFLVPGGQVVDVCGGAPCAAAPEAG